MSKQQKTYTSRERARLDHRAKWSKWALDHPTKKWQQWIVWIDILLIIIVVEMIVRLTRGAK